MTEDLLPRPMRLPWHQASLLLICRLTLFVRLLPCSATAAVTFESTVELDSEANARNYKHKGTSEDLPREFRRDWACCGEPRYCGVVRIF